MSSEGHRRDSSPPDLAGERDALLSGLPRSQELVERQLLLLDRLRSLEVENARLRAKVEADSAVRELLRHIERLESEKQALVGQARRAEEETEEFNARYAQVEAEFAGMANAYVAANQLHSTLQPRRVVRALAEVLAQLVGAEKYCIFLRDGEAWRLVMHEGVIDGELDGFDVRQEAIAQVVDAGRVELASGVDTRLGSFREPVAVVPLMLDGAPHGVVVVAATLEQKTSFGPVDRQLFDLLRTQAAAALLASALLAQSDGQVPSTDAFLNS